MGNVANSRLAQERAVDPLLTNLIRGYSNSELIGNKLFPIVNVEKEAGKIPTFGKDNFRLAGAKRAIGADSNKGKSSYVSLLPYSLEEVDLAIPMDYREQAEDMFGLEKRNAKLSSNGVALTMEKEQADIAQDTATYASTNKLSLTTNINDITQDPIAVVNAAKSALRAVIGKYPNIMAMGATVYEALINHPLMIERIKYSQAGIIDMTWLAKLFDMEEIVVGKAQYTDDDKTLNDIWKDNIILAYVPKTTGKAKTDQYEPSFGYTFRKTGQPTVDQYTEEGGKIINVRTTDIYEVKVVGADAGYLIYGCLT